MWDKIIEFITNIDATLNSIVWGWPVIILILGTGLLLTIRTKFLQIRKFGDSWNSTIIPTVKSIGKKGDKKRGVTQFEAFSTAISGTVGTGNIVGVTAAILTGGPGAVFWMWISAFFGMVTNYSENVLGLYYRVKDKKSGFAGGAFYYIANGLGWKWLGYVAAVFTMLAAVGMSGAQTNKISGTLAATLANDSMAVKLIIGIAVAALIAVIIIGGIKRIGSVTAKLVPFMSILFMILAFIAIFSNVSKIGPAFAAIFENAFSYKAAAGGFAGYMFATVIKKGMARGVFSNEAGLGSSVVAHSASETREPVRQGLWGVFEVFFDTFIVCTLSALMLLCTMDWQGLIAAGAEDTATSILVYSQNFGTFGTVAISVILPLFAFTTILAWSFYGEKATQFLFRGFSEKASEIAVIVFKVIYVLLIVASSVITSSLAWNISDTFNGLMSVPNLICLVALSGTVAKITKNYYQRKKGEKVKPMLSAYPDMNDEFEQDLKGDNEDMK
ncbi:MAG: sodium:alanine symporter family protein [Clostridiales bacterium]|nr:sodium:alanine symporter family protein [Clostridiales bacterium]